ncbi:MAG TPA: protein kinase [Thermoanaerobaculia bacterium]|nr:protein kinase [Thermoanaerobaculia bacterium]
MSIALPTQLGRYTILDEIGRGAMGVVYLARDPLIGRLVALKTFRLGTTLAGRELEMFRTRFIREAQSAGILSHPNIVTIHDVVERSDEGATFIAMEYVRGTDLKERLAGGGRIEIEEAVHIASEVAAGLEYAHSKGVVHRDVKPANILITEDRQVKLTDFGIARLETSNLTLEGQLLGTPNYMAPEQIQGQATDHRADVFSLGVVIYEMLTGEKPFKGENVTVVTHRIVYDEYTPPAEYVGHLPAPFLGLLDRALAKDPAERFSGIGELAEALGAAAVATRSAESLNDTRVIFDPTLLDLPEPPPVARAAESGPTARARAARSAAGAIQRGAAAVATGLGSAARATLRTLRSAAPAGAAPPPIWRLILVAAVTAATASLLGGLLVFAAVRAGAGTVDEAPPEHGQRLAAAPHLRAARAHLDAGDPMAALVYLRRAERAAPDLPGVRARRRQVEDQARSLGRLGERVDRVSLGLEEARIAAEGARWEEAGRAARAVLAVEPENPEALAITGRSERALARSAERRESEARSRAAALPEGLTADESAASEPAAEDTAQAAAGEPPVAAEEPAAATGRSRLELYYFSAAPEGILTVYFDGEQLLSESYRFYRKEGLFRSVPTAGEVENSYDVRSGLATVRILVALPGRPAITRVLEGSVPGGATRRLHVSLAEDHTLAARLE